MEEVRDNCKKICSDLDIMIIPTTGEIMEEIVAASPNDFTEPRENFIGACAIEGTNKILCLVFNKHLAMSEGFKKDMWILRATVSGNTFILPEIEFRITYAIIATLLETYNLVIEFPVNNPDHYNTIVRKVVECLKFGSCIFPAGGPVGYNVAIFSKNKFGSEYNSIFDIEPEINNDCRGSSQCTHDPQGNHP